VRGSDTGGGGGWRQMNGTRRGVYDLYHYARGITE